MTGLRPGRYLIGLCAAAFLTGNALAQYVWTDERGVRQYSDRPPPASVPDSRILKQPGKRGATAAGPGPAASTAAPAPAAEKSTAEKNADFQRRRLENAEKERKETERQQLVAEKARNCERARDYQRSLESGTRLTLTDKQGEQMPMSDEQRDKELKEARRVIADCDKTAARTP